MGSSLGSGVLDDGESTYECSPYFIQKSNAVPLIPVQRSSNDQIWTA